jgi:hypothetical protein
MSHYNGSGLEYSDFLLVESTNTFESTKCLILL